MRVIISLPSCALPSSTRSVQLLSDHALQRAVYTGQEVEELWQEYEDGNSPEALMVKDFDKVCWNLELLTNLIDPKRGPLVFAARKLTW